MDLPADTTSGADPEIRLSSSRESCDLDTFCNGCLRVVCAEERISVMIHATLVDWIRCGEKCMLCRYMLSLFGKDFMEEIMAAQEEYSGVNVSTSDHEYGENRRLQQVTLRVEIERNVTKRFDCLDKHFLVRANGARGINRAIWSHAGPIDFAARNSTFSQWLEECRTEHPKCHSMLDISRPVAARIIEIRLGKDETRIRLVPTEGLDLHVTPYFVLSHCWGSVKIEAILVRDRLTSYFKDIPFASLPKTFREAIEITTALGCRYLWIDSICIIQGDSDDWAKESAKMASIFRGATLTISASEARDSTVGCGITKLIPPATQFTIPGNGFFSARKIRPGENDGSKRHEFTESPIHTRAWILQEKVLSKRILHATQSQFVWQCATHIETEDGWTRDLNTSRGNWAVLGSQAREYVLRPDHSSFDIRNLWWTWAAEYNKRDLTKIEDHYGAFAGVTEFYQNLTDDTPVHGLWKRDLIFHLAWEAYCVEDKWKPLVEPRTVSWTWLTFPHGYVKTFSPTYFYGIARIGKGSLNLKYQGTILDIDVKWTEEPLVSVPAHIHGLFDRIVLPKDRYGNVVPLDPGFSSSEEPDRIYDTLALFAREEEGTLTIHRPQLVVVCLVLEPTGVNEFQYRRIGRFERWIKLLIGTTAEDALPGIGRTITLV
ncbi:HET-domain-containing protein [Massarina eburnea CBS 473.64]|uniref:HET-domain-containing protein n=1 Tax=Massarina eburnea CBS 473.64 TaxID=1395130 RepID=A0A6A6RPR7_9PLEO|nr:HET-domain-containing protein [Massarina eburnea CBS 473.64]